MIRPASSGSSKAGTYKCAENVGIIVINGEVRQIRHRQTRTGSR
jgi:hypothetical protein